MNAARLFRRTAAVAATATVLATGGIGVFAGTALAVVPDTATCTAPSPCTVLNSGSRQITFTTTTPQSSSSPVTLTGADSSSGPTNNSASTLTASTVSTANNGTTVFATFDFSAAAPGPYSGMIGTENCGVASPPCVNVIANPIGVSSVSPTQLGVGATKVPFTVTGTNIANLASVFFDPHGTTTPSSTITFGSPTYTSTTISGQISVAPGTATGAYDVVAENTDGSSAACASCLTITAAPTVGASGIQPSSLGTGATNYVVTLTGTGFQSGMTASFTYSGTVGTNGVTTGTVTVTSPTSATVPVTVATTADTTPSSSNPGDSNMRDLVLTNTDSGTSTLASAVTIVPAPSVSSLSPVSLGTGASGATVTVTGTGLPVPSAAADYSFSGTGVTVTGESGTQTAASQTLVVSVATTAAVSARDITVTDPSTGGTSTTSGQFSVVAGPTVTAVSPASLGPGATHTLTITGTNFDTSSGVSVTIPDVSWPGSPTVVNSTTITLANALVATGASPGFKTVTVKDLSTTNQGVGSCASCFSVDNFAVNSVSPTTVANTQVWTLTINGSGIPAAVDATLSHTPTVAGQPTITGTGGSVNSAGTTYTGNFDLTDVAPGSYSIHLFTSTQSGTCTCTLQVVAASGPTVTSVTPNSAAQGTTRQLTIVGTGFYRGATVSFSNSGISITSGPTFVDNQHISLTVAVSSTATPGPASVTVTNTDNSASTCTTCFTVDGAPTVTTVAPSTGGQGAAAEAVTINGTNFQANPTVSFGPDVTVTVTSSTATTISATLNLTAATTGVHTVTVTNTDGSTGSCASCFTVTPKPNPTSVSPNSGGQGNGALAVTIAGTGFQASPTVSFGSDITVSNVVEVSATQINATLNLTNATPGAHTVTVTNADGGVGNCAGCFTVTPTPAPTSVTPNKLGAGAANQNVTVNGTGFDTSDRVGFANSGITVNSTLFVSATQLTANVSISPSAVPGPGNVTVTNGANVQGTCSNCFTVDAGPTVASISPTSVAQKRSNLTVSITGAGFTVGPVTVNLGTGITVSAANATSATSVTATITVAATAPVGAHDVSVTNPDQGTGTKTGALTVTTPRTFTFTNLSATPVSGAAQSFTLTAKVFSDTGAATDTSYTGTPVLTAPADTHFAAGTCTAAQAGVSSCSGVIFGDLGAATLQAAGTGNDADLTGSSPVTVQPTGLALVGPSSGTAPMGQPASFTLTPTTGVSGAAIGRYDATRTLHTTGTGSTPADGSTLSCGSGACTFTVTWSATGSQTVQVSDNSTPAVSSNTVDITTTNATTPTINLPALIYGDHAVTINGSAAPNATVILWQRTYGTPSYVQAATTTADSSGAYSFFRWQDIQRSYYVVSGGVTSVTKLLQIRVVVHAGVTSPSRGTIVVHVVTGPPQGGRDLRIYRINTDNTLTPVFFGPLNSAGQIYVTLHNYPPGALEKFTAVVYAAPGLLNGASPAAGGFVHS